MAWRHLVVCIAVLTLLVSGATAQDTGYKVRLAQIVHHHGVGSPPSNAAQDACGVDHACGSLTSSGAQMLGAIGSFVRSRYNDVSIVEQPFFSSRAYTASSIYSTSADLTSAIQSANAFLQGVFPSTENTSPAIFTSNHTTDTRISADGVPAVWVKQRIDTAGLEAALRAQVDARFDEQTVQQLAAEAQVTAACADSAQRVRCVLRLYNSYTTLAAAGQLAMTSLLRAHAADLTSVWQSYARYLYAYNASSADDRTQGAAGQFAASALLQNARDSISARRYAAYHYSADATLFTPLSLTLGLGDTASLAPAFGSTLIVELLQRTSDSTYHIRLLRGMPTQLANGSYTYSALDTTQTCTSADGANYVATNNICPLDDFTRYVAQTRERTRNGHCALSQQSYALLNCPTSLTQTLSSSCAFYRELCPASACPSGYALSVVDGRCRELVPKPNNKYVVRLVQIVHRHGARNPLVDFNKTEICGAESVCGFLTADGIQMLLAIGTHMRARYNNDTIVEEPFFDSTQYDPTLVYSRSTALPRTLQSASAFLHGLFPNGNAFIPAIFTVNFSTDVLLNTDPQPQVVAKRFITTPLLIERLNAMADKAVTWEELTQAAAEAYWAEGCSNYSDRGNCAAKLQDIGISFNVSRKLADKPHLSALQPKLDAFMTAYWHYVFDYDATNEVQRKQGSSGYELASMLVSNMQAHLVAPSYKMFHYSTHDSMIAPLSVTLGDSRDETILAPYAATYAVELLQDTGDGSYHVRVLRGYAQQTDTGAYAYADLSFEQHCMYANGTVYIQPVCPLSDFARFIDSTKPTAPEGMCVLSDADYAIMQCPSPTQPTAPIPSYCALYRTLCPFTSCTQGYMLNAADLRCYPVATMSPVNTSSAAL